VLILVGTNANVSLTDQLLFQELARAFEVNQYFSYFYSR